jgi:hypothetical protein
MREGQSKKSDGKIISEALGAEIAYYQSAPLICQRIPLIVAVQNTLLTQPANTLSTPKGPHSHSSHLLLVTHGLNMPFAPSLDLRACIMPRFQTQVSSNLRLLGLALAGLRLSHAGLLANQGQALISSNYQFSISFVLYESFAVSSVGIREPFLEGRLGGSIICKPNIFKNYLFP